MLYHKTPMNKRKTYTYRFTDCDGREHFTVLRPGADGITEADIKRLHALDDSEVYYNLKATNPEASLTPAEKKLLREKKDIWAQGYIAGFEAKYGYKPNPKDVAYAVQQAFPKERINSIEFYTDGDDDDESLNDKSSFLCTLCEEMDAEATPAGRIAEILATFSDKEAAVYERVMLGNETRRAVSRDLGISDTRVSQIEKKIRAILADDKILQSFFR